MTSIGEPVWAEENPIQPAPGFAEGTAAQDDHPAAVLWIPDIDARHGWREYYVRRTAKPGARAMGFQRGRRDAS